MSFLIDTHAHLYAEEFDEDRKEMLQRAKNAGVQAMLLPNIDSSSIEPMEKLAREGQVSAYLHHGFWQPMDTLRDKNHLEELWVNKKAPWKSW